MLKLSFKTITLLAALLSSFCFCAITTTAFADNSNNSAVDYPAGITINGNLWDNIQDHLQLPDYSNVPAVQKQIIWYQKHQEYLNCTIKQAAPYLYYIYQMSVRRNLPAELALLPIIESGYDPFGVSSVGANGLWQMMPGTASGLGLKIDWWYDGRRDLVTSTEAAFTYLAYLNNFFKNDWLLAIAAYDGGDGTVQRAMRYNARHHRPTSFWHLHLPRETEVYVPKLLALSAIIRDPDRYGINLLPINDAPYLDQVDVGSQIDLSQAAKLADVSVETIRKLNPGFRRWATDPNGPFTLIVPASKAQAFKQRLDALPKSKRMTWREHTIKHGDTLGSIALKYNTNINIIRQVNHLESSMIRPGQTLLIPVAFHGSLKSPILMQRSTITEATIPGPHRVVHIAKTGDTMWTIAEKYGVTVRAIRYWNNLHSRHVHLVPNQKLLIWAPAHEKSVHKHIFSYTVAKGDSLSVIAHRFNSSVKAIEHANHLRNNRIKPGQHLTVPGGAHHIKQSRPGTHKIPAPYKHYLVHTIRSGESLSTIAHKFHVSIKDLKKWNALEKTKYIKPGKKLYIYYEDK